jgi:hypothetical protein
MRAPTLPLEQPGEQIAALAAERASPTQVLERFALRARPPIFLRHHKRPTASAAAGQGDDLDGQAVPRTAETVSFAFEFHAIMGPAREFEAWIRRTQEQIEHPEEGRALKAFHTADLPNDRVSRAEARGRIQPTPLWSRRVI